MVSSHNPFRTAAVTPTPTGPSSTPSPSGRPSTPQTSSNHDVPTEVSYAPPPGPPPDHRNQGLPTPPPESVNDLLTQELPPAYTPAPNVYEGESTIEVGPRRPFQQPPSVPRQQQAQFPPQIWAQPTGSSWQSSPGQMSNGYNNHNRQNYQTGFAPPPAHPASYQTRAARPVSTPSIPSGPMSDFAREFYAVGTDDSGLHGGPSSQYQSEGPGALPVSPSESSLAQGVGSPASGDPANPAVKPAAGGSSTHNDGRPTVQPTPGHPLLRHGKVLVYSDGYECPKCRNTGYKNFDPSHPCSRCWDKYAKPYAGAITYVSWTSDGPSGSSSSTSRTFQRPLPAFRAPQSSLHQQSASWSGPSPFSSDLSRAATTSRAQGYPGASSRVMPVAGGALPMSPYLDTLGPGPQGGSRSQGWPPPSWLPAGQLSGVPPSSGSVRVHPPGDPRLGGRLCWRCGGRGMTSFFIFDEDTCGVCGGLGRTYV